LDAGGLQARECGGDVGDLEVQQGTGVVELGLFGRAEHEAYTATIEKTELAGAEERLQAEDIAVEGGGALDVMDVDGDLHDAGEGGVFRNGQDGPPKERRVCGMECNEKLVSDC
jgi:hypothetical protein